MRYENQKIRERMMHAVFFVFALTSVISVILICLFLFANGIPTIGKIGVFKFLLGNEWSPTNNPPSFGILPMILGSIYITAGAIVVGVPIGLMTAVFMAEYCPAKLYKTLKPAVNLLAGIPSIIYGFFGLVVIVPAVRTVFGGNGNYILTASVLLGIMILPTIINISEASIRAVPRSYYEGALALGAGHDRSVFASVLPAAKSGIMSSIVLGIGRAIGETMAVVMVAGNQARMPKGILSGIRTMTANIILEMSYSADLHREALIATGVVLFVFILLINLCFSIITNKKGG